eukprot:7615972-Karenia_brevis.AAC.1
MERTFPDITRATAPATLTAASLPVACIGMNHIDSGIVVGHGPLTIAIARRNRNHVVPLLENVLVADSGAIQQPNADVHDLEFDSAVKVDEEVVSAAISEEQSSFFGDSTESSESMSSRSDRNSTDTEQEFVEECVVEEPPAEVNLLGTICCDPKPLGFSLLDNSDAQVAADKFVQGACGHGDASSVAESVGEGSEFSDISDNSDVFHVEAAPSELPRADEDATIRIVRTIVPHLRDYPLLPCDE